MRARILFLTGSVVVAVAAGWYAFHERTRRLTAEGEAVALAVRRDRTDAEIRRVEQRIAHADGEREQAQAALAKARAVASAPAAPAARPTPAQQYATVMRDALQNDPHLQNLQLAASHAKLMATYQPFAEQLKLTEAQQAQLLANLRKRSEADLDLRVVMEAQRLAPNDPAVAKLNEQAAGEFRAAQIALLGEAGWRKFEDYARSVPMREFVNELAGAMTVSGAGFTAPQGDALTDLLANASAPYRQGGMATVRNIDWDQALAGATGVLSPAQLALFKNGVIQLRNMDKLRELARRK